MFPAGIELLKAGTVLPHGAQSATYATPCGWKNNLYKMRIMCFNKSELKQKLTVGCSVTMANKNTQISVVTIKNVLSPQSCADGVNT